MKIETKRKVIRISTAVFGIVTLLLISYIYSTGYFKENGGFQKLLKDTGVFSGIIFIFVRAIQTTYPIIPFGLLNTIGGLVFGVLAGGIYNVIATYIGSYVNFVLGKKYGETLITAFIDEESYKKYKGFIDDEKKFKKFLILGFLLPLFPDDILCMIAGTSSLTKKEYMKIVIIFRPISVILFTVITSQVSLYLFKIFGV